MEWQIRANLTVEISVIFQHYTLRCLDLVYGNRPPPLTTVWQWDQLSFDGGTDDSPLQFRAVVQDFDYITSHARSHDGSVHTAPARRDHEQEEV